MILFALLALQAPDVDLQARFHQCTDQAAYYAGYSDEPLAEAARIAVSLCDEVQFEIAAALYEQLGDQAAAERRVQAFVIVATQRAERVAFRVCRQDIGCNAFLDDRGINSPSAYRK